ncbi:MAG: hypothetical protein PF436_09975 [Prolixibacteraceae bacterium]|jgi:hypothetical protein|nr:hypothetical protein [Prolixibacteraceae bacterium]
MKKKIEIYLKPIGAVLLATIVLCFWAFYNTYPLYFNSDSAAYLDAAFYRSVGPDRPIIYGLWMYFLSFQRTLWPVVITQSLIVALLLYYWFFYFNHNKKFLPYYLVFIFFVTLFTGASFETSWLMPDVFTGIAILSAGLLLFVKNIRLADFIIISFLTVISIVMHNSHFYICLGLILIWLTGFMVKSIKSEFNTANINLNRALYILLLIIVSHFSSALINLNYGGSFKSSNGGTIFFMGTLVEMGVIDTYLGENCETKQYDLCQYKDTLPNNFIWASNSPIHLNGGWDGNKEEYGIITKEILTTPRYLKTVVFKSAMNTLKQFFHFDTGEANTPTPKIKQSFSTFYPEEYKNLVNSKQYNGLLNFRFTNYTQTIMFALSLFVYLIVLFSGQTSAKYRLLIIFIFLALIINAWICGTFSGVFFRYQARLVWLLSLPIFLYATEKNIDLNFLKNKISTIKKQKL